LDFPFSFFMVLFFVRISYLLFLQKLVENVKGISGGDILSALLILFS